MLYNQKWWWRRRCLEGHCCQEPSENPLFAAFAQKEDFHWVLGSNAPPDSAYATTTFDFNATPASIELKYKFIGFEETNANISDSNGNLLCYTNGVQVYNAQDEVIENGADFQSLNTYLYGYTVPQGALIFPFPDHQAKYVFILEDQITVSQSSGWLGAASSPITYSIIDMVANAGTGNVTEKKTVLTNDTLMVGQLTGIKQIGRAHV